MNSQKPSSHKKYSIWKVVVITSLALNIPILGVIGGAALRFGRDGPRGKAKFDAVAESVNLHALSREDQRKLGMDMREKHNDQSTT